MNTYALLDHDIYLTDRSLTRKLDSDSIRQTIETRLLTVQYEFFLNLDAGLPWYTDMTGHGVDLYLVRSLISEEIINTDGVLQLEFFDLLLDKETRKLEIQFKYTDIFNKSVTGTV